MLKILEKRGNRRPIHIITRSPNQNSNLRTEVEIKPIGGCKGSVVISGDMLVARNSFQVGEFFTRRKHGGLDV